MFDFSNSKISLFFLERFFEMFWQKFSFLLLPTMSVIRHCNFRRDATTQQKLTCQSIYFFLPFHTLHLLFLTFKTKRWWNSEHGCKAETINQTWSSSCWPSPNKALASRWASGGLTPSQSGRLKSASHRSGQRSRSRCTTSRRRACRCTCWKPRLRGYTGSSCRCRGQRCWSQRRFGRRPGRRRGGRHLGDETETFHRPKEIVWILQTEVLESVQ